MPIAYRMWGRELTSCPVYAGCETAAIKVKKKYIYASQKYNKVYYVVSFNPEAKYPRMQWTKVTETFYWSIFLLTDSWSVQRRKKETACNEGRSSLSYKSRRRLTEILIFTTEIEKKKRYIKSQKTVLFKKRNSPCALVTVSIVSCSSQIS